MPRRAKPKSVETITHPEASRANLPSAEHQPLMDDRDQSPLRAAYQRRNRDLDPQLVWRGKDEQDAADLVVNAPPLYIQERVHPKALVDDLLRQSAQRRDQQSEGAQPTFADLFADFNGLPSEGAKTEFYQHSANWSNRMILGDSLQVMASLAEREGLRGQVQCIYLDPPYGIKFDSNFQWSTTSRAATNDKEEYITREPEQVKAFRDTWRDGAHSYLAYLRDRFVVARELLTESGSIFVQIGDENAHLVKTVMDEVFGDENAFATIVFKKKSFTAPGQAVNDYILHYAKDRAMAKLRPLYLTVTTDGSRPDDDSYGRILTLGGQLLRPRSEEQEEALLRDGGKWCKVADRVISQHYSPTRSGEIVLRNRKISPGSNAQWAFDPGEGIPRLERASRLYLPDSGRLSAFAFWDDVPRRRLTNFWQDTTGERRPTYVVQTSTNPVSRCILLTTDPGDLVLDPTCGSGTTAYVAEQWGRRWITVDTSRVALALARARVMAALYPYYYLADSVDGQRKEADLSRRAVVQVDAYGDIRQGFVYGRAPRITLRDITKNTEIDMIWEEYEQRLAPLRKRLSEASGQSATLEEWEIPREPPEDWAAAAAALHAEFWEERIARQREIDASIARNAEYEYLYDKPYEDNGKVRVAGPFTVESISPHRTLEVDEHGDTFDRIAEQPHGYGDYDFAQVILENLRTAGVQQAHREDRIEFDSLAPWPGELVCAEGRYNETEAGGVERRAGVFIGPEFGTVSRADLVAAAKEAAEAGFDVLIACAFNYDAHTTEFEKLGRIPVLKARMNADLHMADELKNTGAGNLFVIFGEPDIDILEAPDDQLQVKVNGVDVFHPSSGEVRSDNADGIACWFIDTDYNEEAFFVRHAYFLGANDPYKALKTTLKAEIDREAWESLHGDTSRPFARPESGRIAVKVINHLGDEVMKVFRVD